MFKTLRRLVRIAYGDDLPPVERWALTHANKCSADDIIAAAIVESYHKHPEDWRFEGEDFWISARKHYLGSEVSRMTNIKKNIVVHRTSSRKYTQVPWANYRYELTPIRVIVGDVESGKTTTTLNQRAKTYFLSGIRQKKTGLDRLKHTADRALEQMKANERAWDIAESLLGFKRNEHGALVPVKTVEDEHSCGCDFGECCQFCDPEEEA